MNIEQICEDAIAVVEKYLTSGGCSVGDEMYQELSVVKEAVEKAWGRADSHKSRQLYRFTWHACVYARYDDRSIARKYVIEYKGLAK